MAHHSEPLLSLVVSQAPTAWKLLARLREIVDFKGNDSWVGGQNDVFLELSCLRNQSQVVQSAVIQTIWSSAWFAHSESILMKMLCSKEEEREGGCHQQDHHHQR